MIGAFIGFQEVFYVEIAISGQYGQDASPHQECLDQTAFVKVLPNDHILYCKVVSTVDPDPSGQMQSQAVRKGDKVRTIAQDVLC